MRTTGDVMRQMISQFTQYFDCIVSGGLYRSCLSLLPHSGWFNLLLQFKLRQEKNGG